MSRPGELLASDRSLVNSNFETYKLHSLDPDTDVAGFALPGSGATQSRVGHTAQQLGFKEVRARIAHDHLDTAGGRGVYIDVDWNVVGFELNDALQPTFSQLATLPTPISSDQHAEYPRAIYLSDTCWAVSSGTGTLYILAVSAPGSAFEGKFVARYDLALDGGTAPFLLVSAHTEGAASKLLIARAIVQAEEGASRYRGRKATFALAQIEVNSTHTNGVDAGPEHLTPRWTLTGNDIPYWAAWSGNGWVILSEDPFHAPNPDDDRPETDTERATREHNEKVAHLGLGASLPESTKTEEPQEEPMQVDKEEEKTYAFSWTQDTSSVTITVPVPSATTRKDINVKISPDTLSLSINSQDNLTPPLSSFVAKGHAFWSNVVQDESTWTYDAAKGEIEIELQKSEGDTIRWPSVFVPGGDDDDEDDFEDVPETFAPSTLAAFRESFNHAVHTRDDNIDEEPHLPPRALPALLREEMDLDFDDDEDDFDQRTEGAFADLGAGTVGRSALIGFVSFDGTASWSHQPASVLSLPVTCAGPDHEAQAGIIVKTAVDGLVFTPPRVGNPSKTPWVHAGTNPALAFVISSKRDLRLVRHVSSSNLPAVKTGHNTRSGNSSVEVAGARGAGGAGSGSTSTSTATSSPTATLGATVFAFDSGSGTGNGNVYIYYAPTQGNAQTALQGVVSVSGGDRGSLLGVGAVSVNGRQVVVALCENQLVVLGGVL